MLLLFVSLSYNHIHYICDECNLKFLILIVCFLVFNFHCHRNPELVVDCMELAVLAKFPFRRYYAGYDTWAFRFLALMPDIVGDFLWASKEKMLGQHKVLPPAVIARKNKN